MPSNKMNLSYATYSVSHDDSLTPVDKSPMKLHINRSDASRLVLKPLEEPTVTLPPQSSSSSLTSMMHSTRRASYDAMVHRQFAGDVQKYDYGERRVSFDMPRSSDSYLTAQEPPQKKRRFQRRNSKTAAMLFSSMAAEIAVCNQQLQNGRAAVSPPESVSHDLASATVVQSTTTTAAAPVVPVASEQDSTWDGGLEIAEDLVRQLKLRRRSNSIGSSTR